MVQSSIGLRRGRSTVKSGLPAVTLPSRPLSDVDAQASARYGHHFSEIAVGTSPRQREAGPEPVFTDEPIQGKAEGVLQPRPDVPVASGDGQSLPPPVLGKMQRSFGHSFSDVRIHSGAEAKAVGALAYTRGEDIHFQPGLYDPSSLHGQELLGHELTHVIQQRVGRVSQPQSKADGAAPINADSALEAEADRMGHKAASGQEARVTGAGRGLQRKADVIQRDPDPEVPSDLDGLRAAAKGIDVNQRISDLINAAPQNAAPQNNAPKSPGLFRRAVGRVGGALEGLVDPVLDAFGSSSGVGQGVQHIHAKTLGENGVTTKGDLAHGGGDMAGVLTAPFSAVNAARNVGQFVNAVGTGDVKAGVESAANATHNTGKAAGALANAVASGATFAGEHGTSVAGYALQHIAAPVGIAVSGMGAIKAGYKIGDSLYHRDQLSEGRQGLIDKQMEQDEASQGLPQPLTQEQWANAEVSKRKNEAYISAADYAMTTREKQAKRGGIELAANGMRAGGSALALGSSFTGAGYAAGMGIAAGGTALEGGALGFRTLKQAARDDSAQRQATPAAERGIFDRTIGSAIDTVFAPNTEKTSHNKKQELQKHTSAILQGGQDTRFIFNDLGATEAHLALFDKYHNTPAYEGREKDGEDLKKTIRGLLKER
jgi:hypothetical protein